MNTEHLLDEYIRSTAKNHWDWGRVDCTLWVADWWKEMTGQDPALGYRGSYWDEKGAIELISGGLLGVAEKTLPDALRKEEATSIGDVGVILIDDKQVCAIWTGLHWLYKTPPRGVGMVSEVEVLAVWGK